MEDEDEVLARTRQQAYRFMQIAFSLLSIVAVVSGLAAHHFAVELGISEDQPSAIANSFLFMGAAYMLTLFVWDSMMRPDK